MATPTPMYDDDEEAAMDSMLHGAPDEGAAEKPAERESPEKVIGQIKSMVAELQELASQL